MIIKLKQFYYGYLENLTLSIMIKQIKDKYDFKEEFDFYGWLRNIKSWSDLYNEHKDQPVTQFVRFILDRLTCFVEEITVHCLQAKMPNGTSFIELPLSNRNFEMPLRFRVAMHHLIIMIEQSLMMI